MRLITSNENKRHGCSDCANRCSPTKVPYGGKRGSDAERIACPFDRCPYTEMDEYSSYVEFLIAQSKEYGNIVDGMAFA